MSQFVDAIIFVPVFSELVTYLNTNAPDALARDKAGNITTPPNVISFARTPAVVKEDSLLAYCRFTNEQATTWRSTPGVEILAEAPYQGKGTAQAVYDQVFADPELLAIYDSVYDRTPRTYTDDDGVEYTATPPAKFGVMA